MAVERMWSDEPEAISAPDADAEAFAHLYARWHGALVEFCRSVGTGDDDPHDVAQEAFLKAWAAWPHFEPDRPFWPWLATIAKRCCVDRWRRQTRDAVREQALHNVHDAPQPSPEDLADEAAEREVVRRAFANLRPGEQRIMGLQVIEGWTYSDIAHFEDVSVDSVRGTLRRARAALRHAYSRAFGAAPVGIGLRRLRDRFRLAVARVRHAVPFDGNLADRAGLAAMGAAALVLTMTAQPAVTSVVGDGHGGRTTARPAATAMATGSNATGFHASTRLASASSFGAAPSARSTQTGTQGPSAPIPRLPVDNGSTPESGYFTQFAEATGPGGDGIVFAVGSGAWACGLPSCPMIYRSDDAGTTWARLPALGYTGGKLLLPPSFPADHRLFVATAQAVAVSGDNGGLFLPVTSVGGDAAMSPAFSSGDPRILLSAAAGWEYRDDTNATTPLLWGTTMGPARKFAFSPSHPADPRILVTGDERVAGPMTPSLVQVCRKSVCDEPVQLPGATGAPDGIAVAPSFARTGLAFTWRIGKLYRTVDGARSFSELRLPKATDIKNVVFADDDTVYAASAGFEGTKTAGGLFVSRDRGDSWTQLGAGTVLDRGVAAVALMRNGRLLVAPVSEVGGVLCSTDGGRTWASRCTD